MPDDEPVTRATRASSVPPVAPVVSARTGRPGRLARTHLSRSSRSFRYRCRSCSSSLMPLSCRPVAPGADHARRPALALPVPRQARQLPLEQIESGLQQDLPASASSSGTPMASDGAPGTDSGRAPVTVRPSPARRASSARRTDAGARPRRFRTPPRSPATPACPTPRPPGPRPPRTAAAGPHRHRPHPLAGVPEAALEADVRAEHPHLEERRPSVLSGAQERLRRGTFVDAVEAAVAAAVRGRVPPAVDAVGLVQHAVGQGGTQETPVNPALAPSWDSARRAILYPVGGSFGRSAGSRSLIGPPGPLRPRAPRRHRRSGSASRRSRCARAFDLFLVDPRVFLGDPGGECLAELHDASVACRRSPSCPWWLIRGELA